jgi:hypothetical protein
MELAATVPHRLAPIRIGVGISDVGPSAVSDDRTTIVQDAFHHVKWLTVGSTVASEGDARSDSQQRRDNTKSISDPHLTSPQRSHIGKRSVEFGC